jgi:hypothetical protein
MEKAFLIKNPSKAFKNLGLIQADNVLEQSSQQE